MDAIRWENGALAVVLLGVAASIGAPRLHGQEAADQYEFRYHTYAETTTILEGLANRFPQLAKLYSIGKSATGTKEIWVLEISNQEAGSSSEKPAVYFDGNQHDSEVMGGEAALYLAHHLVTNYQRDSDIRRLLDTRVVYVIPLANPDGAEYFVTGQIDWDASSVLGLAPSGSDGPEDVNGDGHHLFQRMRLHAPDGEWKKHPEDSRWAVLRYIA
jgi:murein tripeptide amidase MpaA